MAVYEFLTHPSMSRPSNVDTPNLSRTFRQSIQSLKVLIVDDNVDAADVLATFLNAIGHEARALYSAQEVLEHLPNFVPHVLFIDIGMPHIDGCELVKHLRLLPELSGAMYVAFSGYGDIETQLRASEAGFHSYIIKPCSLFTFEALLARYRQPL